LVPTYNYKVIIIPTLFFAVCSMEHIVVRMVSFSGFFLPGCRDLKQSKFVAHTYYLRWLNSKREWKKTEKRENCQTAGQSYTEGRTSRSAVGCSISIISWQATESATSHYNSTTTFSNGALYFIGWRSFEPRNGEPKLVGSERPRLHPWFHFSIEQHFFWRSRPFPAAETFESGWMLAPLSPNRDYPGVRSAGYERK